MKNNEIREKLAERLAALSKWRDEAALIDDDGPDFSNGYNHAVDVEIGFLQELLFVEHVDETVADFKEFGEGWVYCSEHVRAHRTGWCTVDVQDKVFLGNVDEHNATGKCLEMNLRIIK
jgi:hypothetical protein